MSLINVAFTDVTKATITAVFALPQPIESFPYQGEIDTATSAAWATFYAALSAGGQAAWPPPPETPATA